ncbi:MAG: hypothetical protein RMY34_35135 [Aulosira sp. DedQUE10]|nr:hypothetical protein [Aulosira sp. DedQUE10]
MPLSPIVKQGMVSNSIKRTKSIKVYLFEQEKTTIEEKAIATGVTASEYLRSCGLIPLLSLSGENNLGCLQNKTFTKNLDFRHYVRK